MLWHLHSPNTSCAHMHTVLVNLKMKISLVLIALMDRESNYILKHICDPQIVSYLLDQSSEICLFQIKWGWAKSEFQFNLCLTYSWNTPLMFLCEREEIRCFLCRKVGAWTHPDGMWRSQGDAHLNLTLSVGPITASHSGQCAPKEEGRFLLTEGPWQLCASALCI